MCAFVHILYECICSMCYAICIYTHKRLYFVPVCVHFDCGLLEGLYIKWNHFDWPWLQGPQLDS